MIAFYQSGALIKLNLYKSLLIRWKIEMICCKKKKKTVWNAWNTWSAIWFIFSLATKVVVRTTSQMSLPTTNTRYLPLGLQTFMKFIGQSITYHSKFIKVYDNKSNGKHTSATVSCYKITLLQANDPTYGLSECTCL